MGYMNINESVHTGNSFVEVTVAVVPCEQPLKYQFPVVTLCVHHPSCVALTMRGNPSPIPYHIWRVSPQVCTFHLYTSDRVHKVDV